jgi:hypothetical protein
MSRRFPARKLGFTQEQLDQLKPVQIIGAKKSKHGNKRTEMLGKMFDSKREAERYRDLYLMQKGGCITGLELQKSFPIVIGGVPVMYPDKKTKGRQMVYRCDFYYFDENGNEVIEDSKGHRTKEFKIKEALMLAMGYTILKT